MTRFLFVRHGQTAHNSLGQISTLPPGGPLSPDGIAQAQALASRLSVLPITAVCASPLQRAQQTATILAEPHGLPVSVEPDLTEIAAGEVDGRDDPEAFAILNGALDAWCLGDLDVRIGEKGECGHDIVRRFRRLVARLGQQHPGGVVIVVSHGGLLQAGTPWLCTNLTPRFGLGRLVANTAVIDVTYTAGDRKSTRLNSSHER